MQTAAQFRSGKSGQDENFPVASLLISKRHREPILAFYDFVRIADDVADHPALAPELKLQLLDELEAGLDGASGSGPEAVRLRRILRERHLSDQHARDLLRAFRQDITVNRYATWTELIDYCSLSAMPVGRFVLDVHGEAKTTWPASDAICAALQIINHLQDCGADYRRLDRVYLPLDTLASFGARVEDLGAAASAPQLRDAIDALAQRTALLIEDGRNLPKDVADRRLSVEVDVIIALAKRNLRLLRREDPLAGGGRTHKTAAGLVTLATLVRSIVSRVLVRPRNLVIGRERL